MELSFLTWNIWYREDIAAVAEYLIEHRADVICLQELTVGAPGQEIKDAPAYIAEQLGYYHFVKELPIFGPDGLEVMKLATGIFSRWPLDNTEWIYINEPVEGGSDYDDEYRAYVSARIKPGDREITVATTHMSYTKRFRISQRKRLEVGRLIDAMTPHKNRYIFGGDLNSLPTGLAIKEIENKFSHAGPAIQQKTWTTKPFSYDGFEANSLNWRLDYVFATSDMKVGSAEILHSELSDHLPVKVVFQV